MAEISTLFFDIGGVVLTNGWDQPRRDAAIRHFGLDAADFEARHKAADESLENGRITLDGYLAQTVFHQPRAFSKEDFKAFIYSQSGETPGTNAVLDELAGAKRYLMVTLNNESAELNCYRIKTFGLTRYFSAFLTSCYLGIRKPDRAIYRLALDITQRPAKECIFIDDRPENLEPARGLGMFTIHFQNPVQLRAELVSCGVRLS